MCTQWRSEISRTNKVTKKTVGENTLERQTLRLKHTAVLRFRKDDACKTSKHACLRAIIRFIRPLALIHLLHPRQHSKH